jgi:DNA-binding MarR family transcriptional regulator
MTTVGKSDLLEAVVQLLVLITLRDGGPRTIRTLTKQLLSKTAALTFIGAPSVSMAAAKLEMSGWIRKERAVPQNDVGRYVLTDTASKMLVHEVRDWINFGAQWPEIDKTLRNTLKSSDIELEME